MSVPRITPPAVAAVLLGALTAGALAMYAPPRLAGRMLSGDWAGDIAAPGTAHALGIIARVEDTGEARLLTMAAGMETLRLSEIRLDGESLRFTLHTRKGRNCMLHLAADEIYAGDCVNAGSPAWRMRLTSPSSRPEPMGAAASSLAHPAYTWQSLELDDVRVHAPAGTAADVLAGAAANVAEARAHALAVLGTSTYTRPLDVLLMQSLDDMRRLIGIGHGGYADPHGSAVLLTGMGAASTAIRHEVMHVLSPQLWGVPPEPRRWLLEGIATYAGQVCRGEDLDRLAAYMRDTGQLLPIDQLIGDFAEHDDVGTYLQSGSLVAFIVEDTGRDALRSMWNDGVRDAAGTERAWLRHIETVDAASADTWGEIRKAGCG